MCSGVVVVEETAVLVLERAAGLCLGEEPLVVDWGAAISVGKVRHVGLPVSLVK